MENQINNEIENLIDIKLKYNSNYLEIFVGDERSEVFMNNNTIIRTFNLNSLQTYKLFKYDVVTIKSNIYYRLVNNISNHPNISNNCSASIIISFENNNKKITFGYIAIMRKLLCFTFNGKDIIVNNFDDINNYLKQFNTQIDQQTIDEFYSNYLVNTFL